MLELAVLLRGEGKTWTQIGQRLGKPAATVESYLARRGLRGTPSGSKWPPERCDTLRNLVAAGKSKRQAAEIMGLTKGQISGQGHRMKLLFSGVDDQPRETLKRQVASRAAKPPKPRLVLPPMNVAQPERAKAPTLVVEMIERGEATILTLGPHACKWPIGDPGRGNMDQLRFCGEWRDIGEVYCPRHRRASRRVA